MSPRLGGSAGSFSSLPMALRLSDQLCAMLVSAQITHIEQNIHCASPAKYRLTQLDGWDGAGPVV
jgi:hypothetical protein